ncbi:alpha/beta fold hydrolase [Nocardia australiensis]|uniref:alpha/beta fold hydrolase n=1 Tax=Nocardia australiensis TaxID=2887191 RepID=UPI001D158BDA|nr:alpha/beta hydrolase [Nocardia australiensis]
MAAADDAFSVDFTTRPAFGVYLRAWAGADFVDELPTTTIPVKTIVGEHDPAIGAETMKATWMEQLPQCELDVLPNAGHYAMFEAPVALITSVEKVLTELN